MSTSRADYEREWRANNKDKTRASLARFRARHPERVKASNKRWRDANRDKHNSSRRRHRALNSAKYSAVTRKWLDAERTTREGQIRRMLRVAKRTGKKFAITAADIEAVWPSDDCCPVFGIPFAYGVNSRMNRMTPSLDRVDSAKGYVSGNIAVISWRANEMKRDHTLLMLERLTDWLRDEVAKRRTQ